MKVYVLFFLLGVLMDFTSTAEMYWMREAGFSIAESLQNAYIINLSWGLRIVFGILSDYAGAQSMQLTVLFLCSMVVWAVVAADEDNSMNRYWVLFALCLAEFGCSAGITIADTYMVKRSRLDPGETTKCIRARVFGSRIVGMPLGAFLLGFADNNTHVIFGIQSALYGVTAAFVASAFTSSDDAQTNEYVPVKDTRQQNTNDVAAATEDDAGDDTEEQRFLRVADTAAAPPATPLRDPDRNDNLVHFIAFFIFLSSLPDSSQSTGYFMIGPMGFSATDLGYIDAASGLGALAGTYYTMYHMHNACAIQTGANTFGNMLALVIISRSSRLFVDDRIPIIANAFFMSCITSSVAATYSVMATAQSKPGNEATYYATFVTLPVVGQIVGFFTTLAATRALEINHDHFDNLITFALITGYAGLSAWLLPVGFSYVFYTRSRADAASKTITTSQSSSDCPQEHPPPQ